MRPWLLLAALLAAVPAGAQDDTDELLDWARGFETNRGFAMREPRRGDYVSNFGTILEPSCIRGLSRGARERATGEFESDIGAVLQQVRECHERFPWLGGLLSDSISILRRSVVVCASSTTAGVEATAAAVSYPVHTLSTPHTHGRVVGEHAGSRRLYYITLIGRDLADYHSRWNQTLRKEFYYHEALHYTGANNRLDHSTIEALMYDPAHACEPDAFDDRVIFLVALCGLDGHGSLDQIGDRIRRCGLRRGCMSSLTTVAPAPPDLAGLRPPMYGVPFAEGDARFLCERIAGESAAARALEDQMRDASTHASLLWRYLHENAVHTLLTDLPTPAPRFLAALTPEQRRRVAAEPAWATLDRTCPRTRSGRIDIVFAPPECPLGAALSGDPVAAALASAHNTEVELQTLSVEAADALALHIKMGRTLADLDQVERRVRQGYAERCPAAPSPGHFSPVLCDDGLRRLLEVIGEVRGAAQARAAADAGPGR